MNTSSKRLITAAKVGSLSFATHAAETGLPYASTRFLPVDEGHIAYDDTGGSGPLVLAVPGMGDLRSEYRALRPLLQQAGYRVVTMDVRGHGDTTARWRDYSAHAVGRDALALIDHLNAGPAVILGNSFAAGSALWAAHDAPTKVRAVVLLGPVVRDGQPSWFAKTAVAVGLAGILEQPISVSKARGPRRSQSCARRQSQRVWSHGGVAHDDRPIQSRYRRYRRAKPCASAGGDGHEGSRLSRSCSRSAVVSMCSWLHPSDR